MVRKFCSVASVLPAIEQSMETIAVVVVAGHLSSIATVLIAIIEGFYLGERLPLSSHPRNELPKHR